MALDFSIWARCKSRPLEGLMCFCTWPTWASFKRLQANKLTIKHSLNLMITLLLCPFPTRVIPVSQVPLCLCPPFHLPPVHLLMDSYELDCKLLAV